MSRRPALAGIVILCTALVAPWAAQGSGTPVPKQSRTRAQKTSGKARSRAAGLRTFVNHWLGTRYQWGGSSKSGIDCSAYARQMFREVFDVELPRTTSQQIHIGQGVPLRPSQLGAGFEPGDLFFYVDRVGVPNHVVVYLGDGQFSHSASGRGVVVDGFKALWGRRIVGRRVLVPASKTGVADATLPYVPAAGPLEGSIEVPCPPRYRARPEHIRRYQSRPITSPKELGLTEICEWKALKASLVKRPGPATEKNVQAIDRHIEWLESIEALKAEFDESW